MQDELTPLSIKYGTDRHPGSKHHYTPYYHRLFGNRRDSVKKVLEIGVGEGAGLRMWQNYFPNATIFGADNNPTRIFKDNRIQVFFCDQSSQISLEAVVKLTGPDLDLVIDDGSHRPQDQVFSCITLMPLLHENVTYVIEDAADLCIVKDLTAYNLEIPKLQRKRDRYDDFLVVVRHQ